MKNDNLLSIPIGKDDDAVMHYLNLADGYDGPHMLLCGTTGSGKSEFIISYLLFLFSVYTPKELNVCIIDFKGGATAAVFRDFPHIVGISTDLDEIGLKRCMSAIRSEVKKREEAFKRVSEEHLIPSVNLKLYRSLYLKGKVSTPMPELFIVIDEFAELRNLYPKYLEELIMISRIGRSLGIHLILICQQVTGSVDRNILLNTSVRIAFRLLSESESYEVTTEKGAYKLSKAGQFIIRLENTKETLKLQSFYSKMPYPNENRILDTNENVIQTKDFDNGKDLFSVLAEEITQKQYEKAVLLWNDHYVFPTKDIIIAIESISDSEYLLLTKEILIGKTMILETDNPTAKENLKKCLFYGLHTKAYQLGEKKESGYGTFVDIGSEYEMYVLFTKLMHIEECTLLFVDSLDIFSECHYKLLDMFLNILSGKNRNVIVCMFKRPKSSLLGNILRNTDFIFGYEEKTKKYINDTSQIFLNDYFLKDTIASEAAKIPDNPMKIITSIGMTGENLSELTIDPKEITELFIISHRTNKDSFLRHLKEAFAFENIKIIKLNNVSDIEKQETGTLNIYTCSDEKSMLLREIKERLTITSKIIWYGKGFSQCSIFYDLNVTNKPLFMPSDAKEAYLLSEDEAIQFFPYGKESKT